MNKTGINTVKLSDFKIRVIKNSIKRLDISDEEYFSNKYKHYISNSRLSLINPDQGGSAEKYKLGFQGETSRSFELGSAIHELFLQPDEFRLLEDFSKPSAKLGKVVEYIKKYRQNGMSIYDSIRSSALEVGYYGDSLTENRIKNVISKGIKYYIKSKELKSGDIVLTDADTAICKNCLNSLNSNGKILKLVQGIDMFGDPTACHNEDAIFMDIEVTYLDNKKVLGLKMKADNWTIDAYEKTITLNDLKTTGKFIDHFMEEHGSFNNFHYSRQMGLYSWMLKHYCIKKYKCDSSWDLYANMLVVETIKPHRSDCYPVQSRYLNKGLKEANKLIKMVAYHEMFGYDTVVEFK